MAKKSDGEKIKRALPFTLTDAEKARKGELAATLNKKLEAAQEAKKTEVAKHSAGIKELQNKISTTLAYINDGVERREVLCLEVKNFQDSVVEYKFEGKVLENRPMTDADRQVEMKVVKPAVKSMRDVTKRARLPYKDDEDSREEEIAQVHRIETSRKGVYERRGSEAMKYDDQIVVCIPKSVKISYPIHLTSTRLCEECSQEVYITPTSLKIVSEKNAKIFCIPCVKRLRESGDAEFDFQPQIQEQIDEMVAAKECKK